MRLSPWRCAAALPRAASFARLGGLKPSPSSLNTTQISARQCIAPSASLGRYFSSTPRRNEAVEEAKITKFADLTTHNLVHENIVNSITSPTRMGLENMTEVQSATIRSALLGTDVIAQAKTGTGKTLAFLIPMLQRMIQNDPNLARSTYRPPRTSADDIRGIVISPTRELAEQIAEEARKVVRGTGIIVQTAVGGTMKGQMLRQMQRQGCHLLVGTPGRLEDIFGDEYSGVAAPRLKALVLDEADRLLDQGFWPDIQRLIKLLPPREKEDRQTLMFSATIPREVVGIVRQTLKQGFQFVRIIGENDSPTTERVKQRLVIAKGVENQLPALLEVAQKAVEHSKSSPDARPFKAIVYFRSTAEVTLAANIFRNLSTSTTAKRDAFGILETGPHPLAPCKIYSIHSRLTQAQRTTAAESFRNAKAAMLFSSDVTARGMDFPNVTHVVQVGSPQDRESYIHRIGRTARAGKEGEGWILVTEDEVDNVDRMLRNIPIEEDSTITYARDDIGDAAEDPTTVPGMIRNAAKRTSMADKAAVYQTILFAQGGRQSKRQKIAGVNALATKQWGLLEPPMIKQGMAAKLGFAGQPGLRFGEESYEDEKPQGGRFGGGGGRFGGGRGGDSFGEDRGGRSGGNRFGGSGGASRFGDRNGGGRSGGRSDGGGNRFGGRDGGESRQRRSPMSAFD
ncbi:ATP-dependent RNA helicase cyt-19-like protein [Elsinoe fawcettii]|nr:ATP-dependent RNA helicase cyt-19-like protein [Elsinoe fawcettii]